MVIGVADSLAYAQDTNATYHNFFLVPNVMVKGC